MARGLARFLTAAGVELVEIDRPDRQTRRLGKSDPIDAEAAARATLAATATGTPKTRTGLVEAIRVLRVARCGAIKARTAALNTLVQTVVSAPEALHHQLTGLRGARLVQAAAALRPSGDLTDPAQATKLALLLAQYGVGVDVAGITAGDNPDRHHDGANVPPPTHPRLRNPPARPRPHHERGHALPRALHRPRTPTPHSPSPQPNSLTIYRSVVKIRLDLGQSMPSTMRKSRSTPPERATSASW